MHPKNCAKLQQKMHPAKEICAEKPFFKINLRASVAKSNYLRLYCEKVSVERRYDTQRVQKTFLTVASDIVLRGIPNAWRQI